MNDGLKMFLHMAQHDPAVVVGFSLVGVAGSLWFHMLLQLERVGLGSYAVFKFGGNWGIPAEYLKVRKKYGWPGWPVYLMWPCYVVGMVCFVVGLFRWA